VIRRVLNFVGQEFRYWRRNAGSTEALNAGTTRQDSKRLPGKQLQAHTESAPYVGYPLAYSQYAENTI